MPTLVCPVCDSREWASIAKIDGFGKSPCGLVGNLGEITEEYEESYFVGDVGNSQHRDFTSPYALEADFVRFDLELSTLIGRAPTGGTLLDVGAATGSFLLQAETYGWAAMGVEISLAAREIAARGGIEMQASVEPLKSGMRRFDVVTAHHVVEHLEHPLEALIELRGLVVPGGRIVIEVPNWQSNVRRAAGAEWVDLRPDQHRWHFSKRPLVALLERAGLSVVQIGTLGEPVPSIGSILLAMGIPLAEQRRIAELRRGRRPLAGDRRRVTGETVESDLRGSRPLTNRVASVVDAVVNKAGQGKRLYAVGRST